MKYMTKLSIFLIFFAMVGLGGCSKFIQENLLQDKSITGMIETDVGVNISTEADDLEKTGSQKEVIQQIFVQTETSTEQEIQQDKNIPISQEKTEMQEKLLKVMEKMSSLQQKQESYIYDIKKYRQTIKSQEEEIQKYKKQIADLTEEQKINKNITKPEQIKRENYDYLAFDHCGTIESYSDESRYDKLTSAMDRQNVLVTKVTEACFALDKKTFIFLVEGQTYAKGNLYKYTIANNLLDAATISVNAKESIIARPAVFGKRTGKMIDFKAVIGDAGCWSTYFYSYDIIDNHIRLKKVCSACTDKPQEQCRQY